MSLIEGTTIVNQSKRGQRRYSNSKGIDKRTSTNNPKGDGCVPSTNVSMPSLMSPIKYIIQKYDIKVIICLKKSNTRKSCALKCCDPIKNSTTI